MQPFAALTDTAWEARPGRAARCRAADPNAVHEVVFTSGTTGEPKGVMHTPNTTLSDHLHARSSGSASRSGDVLLMASTLGHQTGYLYGYCLNLLLGATAVWMDVWNAEEAARLIEAERVTFTMGATPFLRDLTYTPTPGATCARCALFISAGAPIPRQLVQDARERLGVRDLGRLGHDRERPRHLQRPRRSGGEGVRHRRRAAAGHGAARGGSTARTCPPGAEGDLLVRGPAQFVGLLQAARSSRPTATPPTAGSRRVTGRTLDGDGYVSITGRSKDVIIRGGENIPVVEVENLLYTHPKVAGVAIVAMADPRLGERACAVVIPREGQSITLAEITAFLERQQLARQKFPERLEIVSEFPMTPSGKVQKYRLRQLVAERIAAEQRGADTAEATGARPFSLAGRSPSVTGGQPRHRPRRSRWRLGGGRGRRGLRRAVAGPGARPPPRRSRPRAAAPCGLRLDVTRRREIAAAVAEARPRSAPSTSSSTTPACTLEKRAVEVHRRGLGRPCSRPT